MLFLDISALCAACVRRTCRISALPISDPSGRPARGWDPAQLTAQISAEMHLRESVPNAYS